MDGNGIIGCASVTCEFAGRKFDLRMDFNAITLAEKLTGRNLLDSEAWSNLDTGTVTSVFFACAFQTDPRLTINDVRSLGFKHSGDIVQAVRAAWKASNDTPEEDERPTSGSSQMEVSSVRAQ
jgi:hypothetical protein